MGGPSQAGPGLFGTFSGEFPERKVLVSGFSPLDFAPACGRLKGNQKRAEAHTAFTWSNILRHFSVASEKEENQYRSRPPLVCVSCCYCFL